MALTLLSNNASAQSFNSENKELASFLTRMYNNEPFEGVRVVTDYDNTYLLSVITLDASKYPNQSVLNRVAGVKAMSEASRYFSGSNITSDMIISTTEKSNGENDITIIENIRENSNGYVKQLQQLSNFQDGNGRQVFLYYKKLEIDVSAD
ncbi:MAG: hypothetical protein IKH00_08205 [Bacteroidales bacterium]|nr:hypothetical protein [Bacteroidales bacterium]